MQFSTEQELDAFGNWLSGLADGEGCFFIGSYKNKGFWEPSCHFMINLRNDDLNIVNLIHSFLDCGNVRVNRFPVGPSVHKNTKPQAKFTVSAISDLHGKIIPHFEKYSLRSKKARDFIIWKEAVGLMYRVSLRKVRGLGRAKGGVHLGTKPKWLIEEINYFKYLVFCIKNIREYSDPIVKMVS
jgi:hypothetical protein